ncbi:glycosyltransferase family protein [Rubrivivax albus]|uniref:Glycosyltransferase n=1 Tax=Rubrivivax albus TaxID=2499835 RepID=A0A3S2U4P0_9BURK|nr:glycosyltransferase [Rubrivivax albus]RVT53511.1 glycosyltransferase [Rubrivivax albus]
MPETPQFTSPAGNASTFGRPGGPRDTRPTLLFYCQHSLGIGHLTRSFALVQALAAHFRVVFLNGGPLPPGLPVPEDMERIDLPPLGMDDGHTVVSRSSTDVVLARARRRALIETAVRVTRPAVLLVELFPFGRKKFVGEIVPMIRQAREQPGGRALVVCSLRDLLVDARPDQAHHDDRARWMADRWFDAVLVHADPAFARLEDSFRPHQPLRTRVVYTGFVQPQRAPVASAAPGRHLLVSAGGGLVGEPLFQAAIAARAHWPDAPPMRIVAGPFLPDAAWQALQGHDGVEAVRQVPDMVAEMRLARASLSQCGYNTAMDLLAAGVPALVAPYETATENEQRQRAARLAALGALQCLPPGDTTPTALARALQALWHFTPQPAALNLDGARRSADWLAARAVSRDAGTTTRRVA